MPLDRNKVLSWQTGRGSDQEWANWSGLAPRVIGMMFATGFFSNQVTGRGQGNSGVRRVGRKGRAALAAISAMNRAGLTHELSVNILGAARFIPAHVGEVIDWTPPMSPVCVLIEVDPNGGWRPDDIVPAHFWTRYAYKCRNVNNDEPTEGDIHLIPIEDWKPNESGSMILDRSAWHLPPVEVVRIDDRAVYQGEIDPAGLYADHWDDGVALAAYDHHLQIVNGRWVFLKEPDPPPLETLLALYTRGPVFRDSEQQRYRLEPVAVIDEGGRSATSIADAGDGAAKAAEFAARNAETLLDINLTLAARRMKRRAYGLPVVGPA